MLKPLATLTRTLLSLDGLWNFAIAESPDLDALRNWTDPIPPTLQVPVPASYNDVVNNQTIRDHVGWAYYQKETHVPRLWSGERYFIRFNAATHEGKVFINDELVVEHVGGYMPFEAELTDVVEPGKPFRVTVAVNNVLTLETIPPGRLEKTASGKTQNIYQHDFFNYAGLARSVYLYSTPRVYVNDITVVTEVEGEDTGIVHFDVAAFGNATAGRVVLKDEAGEIVDQSDSLKGTFNVDSAHLWQPGAAYLYQLDAELLSQDGKVIDIYSLPVGIRQVEVKGKQFLINNKPFYFTGFGKHEDGPVRGKGHDLSYVVHDYQLMKWIGANSFRTSHYPYDEEIIEYADRHGIVIIEETAAVGLYFGLGHDTGGGAPPDTWKSLNNNTQEALKRDVRELLTRDKNHPSVVMWSLINEPASHEQGARDFFEPVIELARELDPHRPLTYAIVGTATPDKEVLMDLFDVIALNRYYGWYSETGDLEEAEIALRKELKIWQEKYDKPMMMTEYGADTYAGLHTVLDVPWTEEYQTAFLEMYHRVFDELDSFVGEHIWNFADFQTVSGIRRVDGNKKGVFTRDRRPKAAAHTMRKRWGARNSMGWPEDDERGEL